MINPDKALEIVLSESVLLGEEKVNVIDSAARVISSEICCNIDIPSFNKSAMDGYAYKYSGNSVNFKIVETIAAGYIPQKIIQNNECSKIMTGAMIPDGADRVVRFEYTEEKDGFICITREEETDNIRYKAEDVKQGDKIFDKGTLIRSQEIAALSSMGLSEIFVYKKPMVGLITTGSEIIDPGKNIEPGKIYNSNGPQLFNQITSLNAECKYYGIIDDNESAIREGLQRAFAECDVVIISGGVSAGDYDYVPKILNELKVDLKFEKVAIKPGKPIVFGKYAKNNPENNDVFIFGLPGNPVSTFISFEIFVKPFLYKLMGYNHVPCIYKGQLIDTIKRTNADRVEYKPVCFDGKCIKSTEYHGSAHINVLLKANALIKIDQGVFEIKKGEIIDVRPI